MSKPEEKVTNFQNPKWFAFVTRTSFCELLCDFSSGVIYNKAECGGGGRGTGNSNITRLCLNLIRCYQTSNFETDRITKIAEFEVTCIIIQYPFSPKNGMNVGSYLWEGMGEAHL